MPTGRTGLFALLVGMSCAAFAGQAPVGNCPPALLGEATLTLTDSGHLLLPAKVANRDVVMSLSLASGYPQVFESAARELGLEIKRLPPNSGFSAGREEVTHYVTLEPFILGGHDFGKWEALVIPGAETPTVPGDAVPLGILGSQLLPVVDVEIDMPGRKLSFYRHHGCATQPVHWSGAFTAAAFRFDRLGTMVVQLEVDGRLLESTLLRGGSESTMDSAVARRWFKAPAASRDGEAPPFAVALSGAGLDARGTQVRLRGPSSQCRPVATKRRDYRDVIHYPTCTNIAPFAVGSAALADMKLYIASEQKQIYLMRPGSAP